MNKYFFNHDLSPLLGLADSQIITFIGGGGKTSLMNTLGKEFASHGYPTLLTTTTHIMKPDFLSDESYIENEDLGQLANIFTNLKNSNIKYELDIDKLFGYGVCGNDMHSKFEQSRRIFTENGYSPTITACNTGDNAKVVVESEAL